MFVSLNLKNKTQVLLVEGIYHGVNTTSKAISDADWNCEVPIKLGHDEFLNPAKTIGTAKVKTANSIVSFTYEFFEEINLSEFSGWSAHYFITRDGQGNAILTPLRNIALLKDEPPAVLEAEIRLRGNLMEEDLIGDKILQQLKELETKQEEMRLQLTELKASNETAPPVIAPVTTKPDLGKEMKLALGEKSTIPELVGIILQTGGFQ